MLESHRVLNVNPTFVGYMDLKNILYSLGIPFFIKIDIIKPDIYNIRLLQRIKMIMPIK